MDRNFVVGPHHITYPSFKVNLYGLYRRKASDFAKSIGRELAEGPTLLITDNYYGPVELWPLVQEKAS
jgi:hypothetical protein